MNTSKQSLKSTTISKEPFMTSNTLKTNNMKNLIILLCMVATIVSCNNQATELPDDNSVEVNSVSNTEIISGLYNSFEEGNLEAVLAGMNPDIVWNEAENFIYGDKNPYIGPDSIVSGVFARLGAEWEYWNLEGINLDALGEDGVLAQGRYKAKNKANGKELNAQFAHVWRLKDGKVSSFQQYTDTKQSHDVVNATAD